MKKLFLLIFLITANLFAQTNSTGQLLGYKATDRLLIVNADDFGMCHSENKATSELLLSNDITSATIMVPCPWVKEAVDFCLKNPSVDVGVHLTFTSEWKYYKWGSVASSNNVSSVLTMENFFPEENLYIEQNADKNQVEIECRAQINKLLQYGMKPTHFDNHMGSLYGLETGRHFFDVIFKLAKEYQLPFRLPRNLSDSYKAVQPPEKIKEIELYAQQLVESGFVLPDYLETVKHGKTYQETVEEYYQLFEQLKPGVSELYIHAALPSDEMKAISSVWYRREFDYKFFKAEETKQKLKELGIILVGWKELQDLQIKRMQ